MANRQLRLSSVQIQPAAADASGIAVADRSRVRPSSRLEGADWDTRRARLAECRGPERIAGRRAWKRASDEEREQWRSIKAV